jgi:predicted transcriptional regulator
MTATITIPARLAGRLEKLAAEAGRTPQEMLKYVMRDGFEYTENFVRKVKAGIADADAGRLIPHDQVMAELEAVIEKHAQKKKAA